MPLITNCRTISTFYCLALFLYIDTAHPAQLYDNQKTPRDVAIPKPNTTTIKVINEASAASLKVGAESKSLQNQVVISEGNGSEQDDSLNDTDNFLKEGAAEEGAEEVVEENTTLVLDFNHPTPATSAPNSHDNVHNNTVSRPSPLKIMEKNPSNNQNREVESQPQKASALLDQDTAKNDREADSFRASVGGSRDMRDVGLGDKLQLNMSHITEVLFKKIPYSEYWSAAEKWDHIYKKFSAVQGKMKDMLMKNFLKDAEYYADISIGPQCSEDIKYIQEYQKKSTNYRWLVHMFDALGKAEPGMLAGNLADLGHVIQCIKVRAPNNPSNETFEERFFEKQTEKLGERFRGKYCLTSSRPVLPEKPYLVSRFSEIMDTSILSNISYMGERIETLKQLATETTIPESVYELIDKEHNRLDQIPFESELFQYLILQRNFMYSLPRFMGVCFPSSCTKDDIRYILQKSFDDQHLVVDLEFECEVEEDNPWNWLNTSRLVALVLFFLVLSILFLSSVGRYILVDKLQMKKNLEEGSSMASFIQTLDFLSMDKCVGILFIKTKQASSLIDKTKLENKRSSPIDALKGFLILILIYSQLTQLGCLPVPFMWSKWADAMFPFYRSFSTQIFINTSIWTEAFYVISAYLIALKILENYRPTLLTKGRSQPSTRIPNFSSYLLKRYVRLILPTVGFILMNYVWPRLSNGFVMQDQTKKILEPCDKYAWTNLLLFHNHYGMNETCLWPTFVSASFFQLHIVSFPIILILLASLRAKFDPIDKRQIMFKVFKYSALSLLVLFATVGLIYPALVAMNQNIIVPFLIDYIDYDNYRRVIEWTVMPTYNHITSYMFGIWLAYIVVLERAETELRGLLSFTGSTDWPSIFIHREGSFDSVVSSATTTQELGNWRPLFKGTTVNNESQQQHHKNEMKPASDQHHRHLPDAKFNQRVIERVNPVFSHRFFTRLFLNCLLNLLFALGILISLTTSWYWNGAGQPMSSTETFWFMVGTKLLFNITFCYLFYKYFATRHNSEDPWMITRFLVPIGRMSLTVFYVSWLVIWFDLLTSLYQWHPSHYFIFEKFNEIVFITLILGMFAYGAFEGPFKAIKYAREAEKLKQQRQKQQLSPLQHQSQQQSEPRVATQASILRSPTTTLREIVPAQGFHNMFEPICYDIDEEDEDEFRSELSKGCDRLSARVGGGNFEQQGQSDGKDEGLGRVSGTGARTTTTTSYLSPEHARLGKATGDNGDVGGGTKRQTGVGEGKQRATGGRLSIADQYKLNAELRANYSFASIGLYESAGATDDLRIPQHSANDPQVSLEPTSDNDSKRQR